VKAYCRLHDETAVQASIAPSKGLTASASRGT
jgi:hypothetical protein